MVLNKWSMFLLCSTFKEDLSIKNYKKDDPELLRYLRKTNIYFNKHVKSGDGSSLG